MTYITTEVDLRDIDTDDLIMELQDRKIFLRELDMYTNLFEDEDKSKIKFFLSKIEAYTLLELEQMFSEKSISVVSENQIKIPFNQTQ